MRALVCLWTDSQQWTEFFSNLLLPVSKSAATLSERNKIIQKNQQNQLKKNPTQTNKKKPHTTGFETFRIGEHQEIQTNPSENAGQLQQSSLQSQKHSAKTTRSEKHF